MAIPVDLVIFGASGDLARRKILPSLAQLMAREGQPLRVIGAGRSPKATEEKRRRTGDGITPRVTSTIRPPDGRWGRGQIDD